MREVFVGSELEIEVRRLFPRHDLFVNGSCGAVPLIRLDEDYMPLHGTSIFCTLKINAVAAPFRRWSQ
ncbi:MAG: hypothetical protein CMM55_03510 [Rhodospirillaceae bacterium]|nr:hypothetical protein [Rhodospirillaceae bacterium]